MSIIIAYVQNVNNGMRNVLLKYWLETFKNILRPIYMYLSYGICKNLRNKAGLYLLCHAIVCLIPYLHSFSHVSAEFLWVQLSANSSLEWIWQAELPQSSWEGEFPQSAAFHSWKTKFLCCVRVLSSPVRGECGYASILSTQQSLCEPNVALHQILGPQ